VNDGVWELPPRRRFWLALQHALTMTVTPYIPAKVLRHSRLLICSAVELIKCRVDVEVKVEPRDRNGLAFGASGHMIKKCLAASKCIRNSRAHISQRRILLKSRFFEFEFSRRYSASMEAL
jgi:hypothetical protein